MKNFLVFLIISLCLTSCGSKETSRNEEKETIAEIANVFLEEVWATESILKVPESVYYDEARSVIYVANIVGTPRDKDQEGFISKLKPDGTVLVLEWVSKLNAPKGMGVYKNLLYVTDITEVVVIDIDAGNVVEKYEIEGANFLNDITISPKGLVFVTDSDNNKIHLIRNGEVETWLEDEILGSPNGLYWDDKNLMVASSGDGKFRKIDISSKNISDIVSEIGVGDGIAKDAKGNYIVSSWAGQVFYIFADGRKIELLNTSEQQMNTADLDLIAKENLVLIPTFFDNRVVAYRLKYE